MSKQADMSSDTFQCLKVHRVSLPLVAVSLLQEEVYYSSSHNAVLRVELLTLLGKGTGLSLFPLSVRLGV